jgi:thioredoxin reductase (NADPH)
MATPGTMVLSGSQLELLSQHGEERTAVAGEVLWSIGDRVYPFVAIIEGEAAIVDAAGEEIVRHGASGFLGEVSLLSGQTAYVGAVATAPMRYVAVERIALRQLLFDEGVLSEALLSAFTARRELLQRRVGLGIEVIGPRSSAPTRLLQQFLRANRFVFTTRDPATDAEAALLIADLEPAELPLVRLPGGPDLRGPSPGQVSRALGVGLDLAVTEEVDLLIVGSGPAGLGAAVYGASEGLSTLVVEADALGGQAGTSRRIENYLGFPAGISGSELSSRAIVQARKFGARSATPYRALSLQPGAGAGGRHIVHLEDDRQVSARAVVIATGAEYRRLPVADINDYEGLSVFYAAGPLEAQACGASRVGVIGGGNSAAQAAIWLARGGALVTLLHRRADLAETMSAYLLAELDRYGVAVRNASEVVQLHGEDGRLRAVTLKDGEEMPVAFLFCFLGAEPCTAWLDGTDISRCENGFVRTGAAAGASGMLETNVPGIYAAGDVRAGSIKRCATAVGEGAMAVSLIHQYLADVPA